jgi:hypothetical protein
MVGRTAEDGEALNVLNLIWDGAAWSQPQAITTMEGDVPEWPRLSIGLGNQLNLTWFVRNEAAVFESDRGQYTVWYARGITSAPAQPTVPWPTLILAGEPTATVTPTATASVTTPTPTRAPITPAPQIDIYSETDYLLLAAQSIVPVVALIGLVLVVNRLRRR